MTVKQLCGDLGLWFVLVGDMMLYVGHRDFGALLVYFYRIRFGVVIRILGF